MMIDSHQHFWRLSRGDYDWLTSDLEVLYRDFEPAHLEPLLASHRVQLSVAVQAAATIEETRFLLNLASEHAFIGGVVGWAPMDTPEGPCVIQELAKDPNLRGLRPMIQDLPDDRWMLGTAVAESLEALATSGLCFDALVKPQHLEHLRTLLERQGELPIVIDHGAKPNVAAGRAWSGFKEWAEHLAAIAEGSGAMCKLSGLVTETNADWTVDQLRPFSDAIFEAFGPERVMWGSDWPVLTMNSNYDSWYDAAIALTRDLSDADRSAVFGGNAADFYGIQLEGDAS